MRLRDHGKDWKTSPLPYEKPFLPHYKDKDQFLSIQKLSLPTAHYLSFQVGPGKIISPTPTFFDIKYGKFVHLCAEISAQTDMSTVILSLGEQGFVVNTILW